MVVLSYHSHLYHHYPDLPLLCSTLRVHCFMYHGATTLRIVHTPMEELVYTLPHLTMLGTFDRLGIYIHFCNERLLLTLRSRSELKNTTYLPATRPESSWPVIIDVLARLRPNNADRRILHRNTRLVPIRNIPKRRTDNLIFVLLVPRAFVPINHALEVPRRPDLQYAEVFSCLPFMHAHDLGEAIVAVPVPPFFRGGGKDVGGVGAGLWDFFAVVVGG